MSDLFQKELNKIFEESKDLEETRKRLYEHLNELELEYRSGKVDLHDLDYQLALESTNVFKNVISPKNEKIVGFSTLKTLCDLKTGKNLGDIKEGFIQEFAHLFKAIYGKAKYSDGWLWPSLKKEGAKLVDFSSIKGRKAADMRSDFLDSAGKKIAEYMGRYPSGMEPEIIKTRERNRKRILDYFGADLDDWYRKGWQMRHVFRKKGDLEDLKNLVQLTEDEIKGISMSVENRIPFGITPYYLSLMDYEANRRRDYQIRSQVIPSLHYAENMTKHREDREYALDFMGEHDTSPHDLITRRYITIAIMKPYNSCPQICVYCQRNWEVTEALSPKATYSKKTIDGAIDWFAEHPSIIDVLITGGDPFVLNDGMVEYITKRFFELDHVINLRWGTRIFVTLPMRITDKFGEMLGSYIEPGKRNICCVTHVESSYEITPEVSESVNICRKNKIYVYNQLVLTLEASKRFQNVATRIAMKKVGIDPYYTFYPKGKEEQKDYLVPIARLCQERKEEARILPGIFRTDEPVFNVPRLGKIHLRASPDRELIAITPEGRRIYRFYPWEKGITPVKCYIYKDVSIYRYLKEIEKRGEKTEDYKSIWYYY
ncbi:MAG TPA: KamA family radical SAM protein [Thermoplasmata archaeon]|nr:KamA family radical SAM protein [Thermoplasmata archaeon]